MANRRAGFPYLLLAAFFINPFTSADTTRVYNILSFGAKPDGQTDSTKALLGAWSVACGSPAPATIYVPTGRFLITHAAMSGPCNNRKITLQIDGTLVAPSTYSNDVKRWIIFDNVEGVSVIGGTINGQGASLWACKATGGSCPDGATVSGETCILLTGVVEGKLILPVCTHSN